MADEEQSQRTEAPSGRRLSEARAEGRLPIGRDAAPVVGLLGAVAALTALGGPLRDALSVAFAQVTGTVDRAPFGDLPALLVRPVAIVALVLAAAGAASALVTFVQTEGNVWPERIAPDLGRLWAGIKVARLLSRDFLLDLGIAFLKIGAIGATAFWALRGRFLALPGLLDLPPAAQLGTIFGILGVAARPVLGVALLIAAVDLAVVRWRYFARMRMTKQEAKREAREEDGDPAAKGRRKKRHREIVRGQARREVPRADALVVNPTHVAVAIRYRRDEGRSPRVTAKGKGFLAEYLRELARENGVPIVENIPLARLLYRKVKVGGEIPAQTYQAVATILAFVYRVTGKTGAGRGR